MMNIKRLAATSLIVLLVVGCRKEKEEHVVRESGSETGVHITVKLVGGGEATLVCPKYIWRPYGDNGIQCYLDSYKKHKPLQAMMVMDE